MTGKIPQQTGKKPAHTQGVCR